MQINPSQIIGFKRTSGTGTAFFGHNPSENNTLTIPFLDAAVADVEESIDMAQKAFFTYRKTTAEQKAFFLETIAQNIEALGNDLLQTIHEETALPLPRLSGERTRTTNQLKLFAQLLREGHWNTPIVDEALLDRKPLPRPQLLQMQVPLGVVAVFGASNFPLAFSVAGGDTAAAFAAGCPVVFKAHPAHPATCQLVGEAISNAALQTGMPNGVFSLLHGHSVDVGQLLVVHPLVKAVAFTGSFKGGKALYDAAVKRKEPIPVYAEMGSVNPVFFLPGAVAKGGNELVNQFAASVTQGTGQFCTNPGMSVFLDTNDTALFLQQVAEAMETIAMHPMLTPAIAHAYQSGIEAKQQLPGATLLTKHYSAGITASMVSVQVKDVLSNPHYFEEVFGPSSVAVLAKDMNEMLAIIQVMPGQLTATVHAEEHENDEAAKLIEQLTYKVGRVVMNGFPTGVEVGHAMVHGGPYPATTDSRVTSVGTTSIYRFTRPVCFQNVAKELLPGVW